MSCSKEAEVRFKEEEEGERTCSAKAEDLPRRQTNTVSLEAMEANPCSWTRQTAAGSGRGDERREGQKRAGTTQGEEETREGGSFSDFSTTQMRKTFFS